MLLIKKFLRLIYQRVKAHVLKLATRPPLNSIAHFPIAIILDPSRLQVCQQNQASVGHALIPQQPRSQLVAHHNGDVKQRRLVLARVRARLFQQVITRVPQRLTVI